MCYILPLPSPSHSPSPLACVHVYSMNIDLSLSLYIYIYTYIVHIYIYTHVICFHGLSLSWRALFPAAELGATMRAEAILSKLELKYEFFSSSEFEFVLDLELGDCRASHRRPRTRIRTRARSGDVWDHQSARLLLSSSLGLTVYNLNPSLFLCFSLSLSLFRSVHIGCDTRMLLLDIVYIHMTCTGGITRYIYICIYIYIYIYMFI